MRVPNVLLMVASICLPVAAWAQDTGQQTSVRRPWLHVQAVEPGSEILLTDARTREAQRYVLAVDADSIRVLNLTDTALPGSLADTLRSIASQHPEYFAQAAAGGTVVMGRVRLTKSGVFVGDDQAVELQRIVQTHARQNVGEVARLRRGGGFWGRLGPLGGFFVGGMAGGLVSGLACRAVSGTNRCDSGAFLLGMVGGGVGGGTYGSYAARRETLQVVYRANLEN
jgi:hypothetical protein